MRKILLWIFGIALIMAVSLSGYIYYKNLNTSKNEEEQVEQESEEVEETKEYNYLKIGEWGVASKYSSKAGKFEDVYVGVSRMVRGTEAENIIKEYTNNNSYFVYNKPQEGMEWLVVEYVINFNEFEKGQNGANSDIQTRIKGYGENEEIIVENKQYEIVTQDISNREYTTEQEISGRFATQIPIDLQEYVIVFGNEEYSYCEIEGMKTETTVENNEVNY